MHTLLTQVPATSVLLAFGIPLAGIVLAGFIVYITLRFRQERTERVLETIRHLADRGLPAPPNLLELTEGTTGTSRSPLYSAITLLGVGVGLMLMFWLLGLKFLIGIGAFLACIAIAQLIALRIERPRDADAASTTRPQPSTRCC